MGVGSCEGGVISFYTPSRVKSLDQSVRVFAELEWDMAVTAKGVWQA